MSYVLSFTSLAATSLSVTTLTMNSGSVVTDTTTGLKIGTATTQKLGFFNATPVAQISGSTDVLAGMVTLGFRAASSNPPLNLGTGVITCGDLTADGNVVVGDTSGSQTFKLKNNVSGGDAIQLDSFNNAGRIILEGGATWYLYRSNVYASGDFSFVPSGAPNATFTNVTESLAAVRPSDSGTTNAVTALKIGHESSGTPSAGFGTEIRFQLKSSTTSDRDAGGIATTWATATDATRKARTVHTIYDTAAREAMRFEASGTAAMISFYGAAATAQLTVTGSRGGNAALASLLTQLATLGLIVDGSSA